MTTTPDPVKSQPDATPELTGVPDEVKQVGETPDPVKSQPDATPEVTGTPE